MLGPLCNQRVYLETDAKALQEWIILYKFFNLSKKWFSSQVVQALNMGIGKKDLYGQKE